jgi:hypothetical protein
MIQNGRSKRQRLPDGRGRNLIIAASGQRVNVEKCTIRNL